ncbi:MAG: hypothetical protein NVSMB63_01210 [Sediminibacterium sp.]
MLLKKPVEKHRDSLVMIRTDTLAVRTGGLLARSAAVRADSLRKDSMTRAALPLPSLSTDDTTTYSRYAFHPYLPLHKTPVYMIIDYRKTESKDDMFYLLAGVVLVLAFIKVAFPRYFKNLFFLFFQTTIRQKQTRDQLLQDNLASLLSNLLYVISAGLYIALIVSQKGWTTVSFWWLALYSAVLLVLVYTGKYLFLLFAGWVFNTKEAANSYVFIVFLVNKVIGIMLVPFLFLCAFANEPLSGVALTVSIGLIILLFFYRYVVSFTAIRNNLKVNALHFFLYLCAVELLPLALIYKVLINYMGGKF